MVFIKILAVGLITLFVVLLLKHIKSEFAILAGVAGSIIMLVLISDQIAILIEYLNSILVKTHIDSSIVSTLFKVVGVGYITEFAANICNDAGSQSIGEKLLFCGKIIIMIMSLPILTGLMNIVIGLIQ